MKKYPWARINKKETVKIINWTTLKLKTSIKRVKGRSQRGKATCNTQNKQRTHSPKCKEQLPISKNQTTGTLK